MKKFLSSILVVFLLLLSSCSNNDFKTYNFKVGAININEVEVIFTSENINACSPFLLLDNISFKKHNIDYLFAGDEIDIFCEEANASAAWSYVVAVHLENIKRVKIKRAPIINLTVTTYEENGVEYKKIVADNKKIVLDKEYTNQDEIIVTGQSDVKDITCTLDYKYTYVTLKSLEEGTKLAATYYKKDGITYIYSFYWRNYVNKVRFLSF